MSQIQLHQEWLQYLEAEVSLPYMQALRRFLLQEKQQGKVVYPASKDIFNALNSTLLSQVKVVILGQDPYHGSDQAHGLSFSVPKGIKVPPSLRNIYKELHRDLGLPIPPHGNLQEWAQQGVLLLNATLTVQAGQAGSHQGQGWEEFTDKIVQILSEQCTGLVFMLWGSYAQRKGATIDAQKHCVLKSPHPSPLSAHRGFIGNGHFSKANAYLVGQGVTPIRWG